MFLDFSALRTEPLSGGLAFQAIVISADAIGGGFSREELLKGALCVLRDLDVERAHSISCHHWCSVGTRWALGGALSDVVLSKTRRSTQRCAHCGAHLHLELGA